MKICICGGGSLGHVCAGVLSSHPDVEVSVLTRRPLLWSEEIRVTDPNGKVFVSSPLVRTSSEKEAVSGADIVLLCLPGYLIEETLKSILEVDKETWQKEAAEIEEHYKKFGDRLPEELVNQLNTLKANLK